MKLSFVIIFGVWIALLGAGIIQYIVTSRKGI